MICRLLRSRILSLPPCLINAGRETQEPQRVHLRETENTRNGDYLQALAVAPGLVDIDLPFALAAAGHTEELEPADTGVPVPVAADTRALAELEAQVPDTVARVPEPADTGAGEAEHTVAETEAEAEALADTEAEERARRGLEIADTHRTHSGPLELARGHQIPS